MDHHLRHHMVEGHNLESGMEAQSSSRSLPHETKFHESHTNTLRARFLSPAMLWWRHARVTPGVLVLMCIVSAFCGSWLQMGMTELPKPGGPSVTTVGRTGRRALALSNSDDVAVIESENMPHTSAPIMSNQGFEDWAINASGFSKERPSVTPGVSGNPNMRVIPFQTLSWFPRITYYPNFIDAEKAEHIIAVAKRHLSPSALAYKPGDSIPETQNVRTSTGTFLSAGMDSHGVLAYVEQKIAEVTHLPVHNMEAFNVLRYMPTQHYDSHYDTFDPKEFGKQYSTRIATFLLFLSDVEEGGETVFKREGKDNGNITISDWRTCSDGLGIKVKPRQGDAVLFWSALPSLELDPHALHGACPVIKGEKWSMAKWIRER